MKIIKIINEEISAFEKEFALYIHAKKYKDAKILAKALKRLKSMVIRIQEEA